MSRRTARRLDDPREVARSLVIKVYVGPPREAYCFRCGARTDLMALDLWIFAEGTWDPLCDACREAEVLGKVLRLGVRWLSILMIQERGLTADQWTALGGERYLWELADALPHTEAEAATP